MDERVMQFRVGVMFLAIFLILVGGFIGGLALGQNRN